MELERMHASQGAKRAGRASSAMEHLNLSLPLHVQVPPLPSPNTTAAAAALFRVNQLPAATPDGATGPFGFKSPSAVALKKRQRLLDAHGHALGIYAPPGTPTGAPSQPTPTTAAAAAAAMALSASSPASAASMEQYEQNKRAMMLEAAGSAAGSASEPGAAEMRRRKVGIPKFLRYLFQMLEYEDHAVIAWSHDGAAFQIRDPDELAERVLPKYFKHNKVSSFQRQLNYFGFKKWTKTQTNICTFSHPCFHRDEQDKMRLIKRKERSTRGTAAHASATARGPGGRGVDEPDGGDEDDESDDHAKAPPAKKAKTAKQQAKRPTEALPVGSDMGQTATPPPRGRGRPPSAATAQLGATKKEPKPKPVKAPRATKKSPRAASQQQQPPHEPESDPTGGSDERSQATRTSSRKMQLPTISPASGASSASSAASSSSSSSMTAAALGRLVSHSSSPSPTHAMYARTTSAMSGDAAPVMPVHSDMLLQQAPTGQHSFLRRFANGPYDNGMPDLADTFGGGNGGGNGSGSGGSNGWPSQHGAGASDAYSLSPAYKFPDPTDFGYGGNNGGGNGPSGPGNSNAASGSANAKDYLDVLLESANMDDPQLSAQSAAWEASYQQQHQQHQQQHQPYPRGDPEAAMATFNMLNVPNHHQQHPHQQQQQQHGGGGMQLPSIEDLQGGGRY